MHINQVDVSKADHPCIRERQRACVFHNFTDGIGRGCCDGRAVVAAVDSHHHGLADGSTVAITDGDGERLRRGLALGQVLGRGVGQAVSPAHCAIGRVVRLVDRRQGEGAAQCASKLVNRGRMTVT